MKVRSSIKKIDPDDQIVKRRGRLYVINKKKPRNKQRQGWYIILFLITLSLNKIKFKILKSNTYFYLCISNLNKWIY